MLSFRFSGHESFACRYAWLPKAYRGLCRNPLLFHDEARAMVELGLGKNMVRSLRFWVEAIGLAQPVDGRGLKPTEFAHALLGEQGEDPYLEDQRTLWLLHWKLSSRAQSPLFAWHYLFSKWPYPEFTRTEALAAFQRESERLGTEHSAVTLSQHLDVFLHSYYSGRSGNAGIEDSLDGPLVDLAILEHAGERKGPAGRFEKVYAFRRGAKPELPPALFDFCVAEYWQAYHPHEATLTLRDVALGPGSPGMVFKLGEDDVRARLEARPVGYRAPYTYQPSAVQGLLFRTGETIPLSAIYAKDFVDA